MGEQWSSTGLTIASASLMPLVWPNLQATRMELALCPKKPATRIYLNDTSSVLEQQSTTNVITCTPEMLEDVELGLYQDVDPQHDTHLRPSERNMTCTPSTTDNITVIASGRVDCTWPLSRRSLFLCTELDWTLIRLKDPEFRQPNLVRTPAGNLLVPSHVSLTPPNGQVVVAAGVSGVFDSHSSGIPSGLTLPGSSKMLDSWTIQSLCYMYSVSLPNTRC